MCARKKQSYTSRSRFRFVTRLLLIRSNSIEPTPGEKRHAGQTVSRVLSRARGAATVIYLGRRLPGGSSDLPEGR